MSASLKKSLILGVIAISLVSLVIYLEVVPEPMSMEGFVFSNIRREEIKSIKVENENGTFIFVNRNPFKVKESSSDVEVEANLFRNWYIENNPVARLDFNALSRLVNGILSTRVLQPFELKNDLSDYGLVPPGLIITIETISGTHYIEVGNLSNYLGSYFARYDGKQGFMIGKEILVAGVKDVMDFRDRRIINLPYNDIESIKIIRGDNEILLKRDKNDNWNIYKPDFYFGDREIVRMLIASLVNLKTKNFYDLKYNEFQNANLDYPELVFEVSTKEDTKTIWLSEPPNLDNIRKLYCYTVGDSYFSDLDVLSIGNFPLSIYALRKKKFFNFNPEQIDSFTLIKEDSMPTYVERFESGWLVNGRKGDTLFIEKYIKTLPDIMAVEFPDYKEFVSFEKSRLQLRLKDKNGKTYSLAIAKQVKVLSPTEIQYYAMGFDTSEPFLITENAYKHLSPYEESFLIVE